MKRYSTLQSISTPLSLDYYLPTSLSSSTAAVATTTTLRRCQPTPFSMMQHRSLSSNPPGGGGGGGGGMNLGNIFNNQNNANRKSGETLEQYGVDLTKLAKENKLDPVIGRHEEIRRTLQILGKLSFRCILSCVMNSECIFCYHWISDISYADFLKCNASHRVLKSCSSANEE